MMMIFVVVAVAVVEAIILITYWSYDYVFEGGIVTCGNDSDYDDANYDDGIDYCARDIWLTILY